MKTRVIRNSLTVVLLALAMAVIYMPVSVFADPEEGQGAEIVPVSDWQSLQNAINDSANKDKTIQLTDNIGAKGKDYLSVSGKTVTIDLNGKQLSRGMTKSDPDGHVFWVCNKGNLTIIDSSGNNSGQITGGWANNGGGINIQEGSVCTIEGGTITGNKAGSCGGGIIARGSLIMTGGSITGNSADTGGGLFCTDKATEVSLENVTISENESASNGPGIDTHAAMTIEKCNITGNECSSDSGGGIYVDASGKKVVVKNTVFKDNNAKNDGGGIRVHRGTVEMTKGSIIGCSAGRDGGGVYIMEGAVFDANSTYIAKNSCKNSGGGIYNDGKLDMEGGFVSENGAEGAGGGIFCDENSNEVTLTNVVIDKNEAKDGTNGGGIDTHVPMTIDGCSIRENTSGDNGGGLYVDAASKTVTVTNTDIADNVSADDGGGIYIMRGNVNMTGGSVTGSSADDGGGVYVTSNTGFTANGARICENKTIVHDGAGILNKGQMTLENCEVSNNTAKRHAGGIWNNASGKTTTITNTHIDGNTAEENSGGGIFLQAGIIEMTNGSVSGNTSKDGGGLFITENTSFKATGTQINKNKSTKLDGGGLVCKGLLTLTECEVSENKSKVSGGGIWYNNSGKEATITDTHIDGNVTTENGGGIYLKDGAIRMTGTSLSKSTLSGNTAEDGGGVVVTENAASSGEGFFADTTSLSHNRSTNEDGGAVMSKGHAELKNCTLNSNSSVMHGGAVYSNANFKGIDNDLLIENTSFTGNISGEGGAIYIRTGDMTLKSNAEGKRQEFKNNGAGSGGAIFVYDDADAYLTGSSGFEFSGNFAKVDGGAIYNDGDLHMENSVKIGDNNDADKKNTVSDGNGAAIYQIGGLWVKDRPEIYDDIFLDRERTVNVNGALNNSAVLTVAAEVTERKITENYKSNTSETEVKFFEPASDKYYLSYVGDDNNGEIYIKEGSQDLSDAELLTGDALDGVTVKLRPSGSDLAACVKYSKEKVQLDPSKVPDADDVIDELRIDYNPVKDTKQDGDNKHADRNGDRWYLQKAGENCYRFLYYVRTRDAMPSQHYVLGLKGDMVYVSERNGDSADQKWEIYKLPDSTYVIKNVGRNKYWSADELDDLNAADRDKTEVRLREIPLTWWMEVVNKKNAQGKNCSYADYNAIADVYDTYNQVTLDSKGKKVTGHDWMSHLPDDLYFTDFTIPSSHDTSAFNVDDATIKRCQEYYLDELMNQGLRGLDIRIGDWDGDHGSFKIVHSYSDIYKADGSKLYLEDILQMTFDFLEKNPTEFFLFKFQPDIHEDYNAPFVYQYLKNLATNEKYKDRIYFFNSLDDVPTIGDLRGKLLLHYDCMSKMDKLSDSDIDELEDDVEEYAKVSDKFSTIANIAQLKNENDWWRVNADDDPETEYWVYDFIDTVKDDPGWDPKGSGEFCGRTISRKTIELWHENSTGQTPFGDPVEQPNWFKRTFACPDWGNKWRDMKNDLISPYSAYHLRQNVESRGKKAWIKLTNYCTKCPYAYPTWSAHELHPVLLELLHSGEFMTAHDGYAGECRFNFVDRNLCWSTYRLNFTRNSSYDKLKKCVPGNPKKENEIKPTCTTEGSYDLVTYCASHDEEVEVSRNHVTVKSLGHDWDDGTVTKKATSFDAGVITYTCKRDGCEATKTKAIAPKHTEHDWGQVVYVWAADGSKVKASRACTECVFTESETAVLDESGTGGPGKITKEVTKPATCEEAGETTYTAVFENSIFGTVTIILEDIPALDHDWDKGEVTVDPSCETEGTKLYTCQRDGCGETMEESVPALGHKWPDPDDPDDPDHQETVVIKDIEEPTCTSEGHYTEEYYCERCMTLLAEANFVTAALGHDWGEWTLVAAQGDTPDHYERVCNNDSNHVERRDIDPPDVNALTEVAAAQATCTQAGNKKYWLYHHDSGQGGDETQAEFVDRYFVEMDESDTATPVLILTDGTRLKEVNQEDVIIPSLGHDWSDTTYAWAGDGQSVTASHVCKREECAEADGKPAHEEETASVGQDTIIVTMDRPATCTEMGAHRYVPIFSNPVFEEGKDVEGKIIDDIPMADHEWTSPTYDWAVDNSEVTAEHKCRNCSANESETANAENGKLTVDVTEPTETKTGKRVYTATFENKSFEGQTKTVVIPMIKPGDSDDSGAPDDLDVTQIEETQLRAIEAEPATCTKEGHSRYWVYEVSEAEAQAGYTDLYFLKIEEGDTAEAVITLSDGTKLKKVKKEEVVIPALGHKWGAWSVTKQATLTKKGEKKRTCSVCGETETQPTSYTIKGAKVVLSKAAFTYSSKARKPSVKTIGGKRLKAGTDFTVAYKNNKNVGKATVTIQGKGNYTGTLTKTFRINPKGTSLKKLKKGKKSITVKWKKQAKKMSKVRITGYQIQLATNKKFTKNKKTVTVKGYKKVSKKVTKLKGGKKYYVKIRTYKIVGGKKYYSPWSKVKTVKTKK